MARAHPGRAVGAVAAATVAALLLAGCGDDGTDEGPALGTEGGGASSTGTDSGAGSGTGSDLTVEAHDIDFDRDAYQVAAGPVDISYTQEGALPHSLVIETAGGGDVADFKLEVDGIEADSGTVDLSSGDYVLYCDVAGHRGAGMEAELRVD